MNACASTFPELPAHVWRGRELAQAQEKTVSTGHPALDAELPGKGWPVGHLVEILQQSPGQHVWQLLGPGLALLMESTGSHAVLVQPPHQPFGPSLRAQGLSPEGLLCVHADKHSTRLWATEQALRCADVGAVLAWLPQCRQEDLRRLHLCAQSGDKLLVVYRTLQAQDQSSPARLRVAVEGLEAMQVRILKRRGPPLLQPLLLPSQPERLAALLSSRKTRRFAPTTGASLQGSHVLDRAAALAP